MSKHEERQKALQVALRDERIRHGDDSPVVSLLEDCIAIPREEWENYRKALWKQLSYYIPLEDGEWITPSDRECLTIAGFIQGATWTPAAHAFAKETTP